jgi:capsular exopolysaccharide synthesis family protein
MDYRIVTLDDPNSQISEIYRSIRTNIEYANIDTDMKVINVTSTIAGEAKSTTAANLAVICANKYKRVLLIDMDLRNPSIHKLFKLKNEQGLTNLLMVFTKNKEDVNLNEFTQNINHPSTVHHLDVLTTGYEIANPTEVLGSQRMKQLLQLLKKQYDLVIIDSAPSGIIPDGIVTSLNADGTVYVLESGKAKIDLVQQTIHKLKDIKVNLLGVVMTKAPVKTVDYGYYNNKLENDHHRIKIDV